LIVQEDPMATASPFQVKAIEEGLYFEGGKPDDVSVVVGLISLNEDSPSRRVED
jgi:protein phosphatase PTC7